MILDYTCRARWPFRAFAQESLKIVTSPTSYRKYPQNHQNSGLPRIITQKGSNLDLSKIAHFSVHFYSHRNQIALSIYGDTSFSPSFLRSIVYFKAISHISGSKKWLKRSVTDARTHGRTDAHQKFEASCTKALKGKNEAFTLETHLRPNIYLSAILCVAGASLTGITHKDH